MFPPQCYVNDPPDCAMVASFRLFSYNKSCAFYTFIDVQICRFKLKRYYLFNSPEKCSLPLSNNCINMKMQLNIGSLKIFEIADDDLIRTPIGTDYQDSDYYITMYISRDNKASGDDLAFTCTNKQPKVCFLFFAVFMVLLI